MGKKAENARKILATGSCEDINCEHCYLYDTACEVNPEIGIGAAERKYLTTRLARYDAKERRKATEAYTNSDITVEERIKRLRKRAKEVFDHFGIEGKTLQPGEFDASLLASEVLAYLEVLDRMAPQTLPEDVIAFFKDTELLSLKGLGIAAELFAKYVPAPQAAPQAEPAPFDPATATYPLMMMVRDNDAEEWIGPYSITHFDVNALFPYRIPSEGWKRARLLTPAERAALRFE